jgi:hypothetical protein
MAGTAQSAEDFIAPFYRHEIVTDFLLTRPAAIR